MCVLISEIMEANLYVKIVEMITSGITEKSGLKGAEIDKCKKKSEALHLRKDGALMWHDKKVPAMGEMEQVLWAIHYDEEKHCQDKKMLRKALSDKRFALTPFMGGIERACAL